MIRSIKYVILSILIATVSANAYDPYGFSTTADDSSQEHKSHPVPVFKNYFLMDETVQVKNENYFAEPMHYLNAIKTKASNWISLLRWVKYNSTLNTGTEPYNRKKHFGSWMTTKNTCLNTRHKVLIRDSVGPITYKDAEKCLVEKGEWHDPYTDKDYYNSADIQIDHVVALKHTYITGGWKWTPQKKCTYANFMGFDDHLLSVFGDENMRKLDKSPDQYIPPNNDYTCDYIKTWLSIKLAWQLAIVPSEAKAITDLLKDSNCNANDFKMAVNELKRIRVEMTDPKGLCTNFKGEEVSPAGNASAGAARP